MTIEQQFNRSVGRTVAADGTATNAAMARVVLQKDASSIGYYVKTAYPVP